MFGKNLQVERKRAGHTTEAIATICGISRSYVTLIESGKRLPSKKVLPKIALALGLPTALVLDWYLEDIRKKLQ